MTANINVQIQVDPKLERALELSQNPRILLAPMQKAAAMVEERMEQTPRKSPGAFSALATPLQKRAYWARVHSGEARQGANGYVRTKLTSRRWTSKAELRAGGVVAIIGNNAPAAPWVYGATRQQPFHAASGWPRADTEAKKNAPRVIRMVNTELRRILNV